MCILEVGGDERLEPFLACSVPQLEPHHFAGDCDVLGDEVDADSGLSCVGDGYILGGVEFIADVAGYYGALADILVADKNYFELLHGVAVAGK